MEDAISLRHARHRDARSRRCARRLSRGAQRRGAQAAERGPQPHGVVRERRALRAPAAGAVCLQPADRQPAHRPREPEVARSAVRRRLRALAGASTTAAERRARRCSCRSSSAAWSWPIGSWCRPMAQYCAKDGMPDDWHLVHYGHRALGGAGLVYTEMTCVSPEGRITPGCTGLWNEAQRDAWRAIVEFVHAQLAGEILPAARTFRPQRLDAARLGGDGPPAAAGQLADPRALAAAVSTRASARRPVAMTRADMDKVRGRFRARHPLRARGRLRHARAAHGARLSARLLPLPAHQPAHGRVRRRRIENRLRFPLEVLRGGSRASGRRTSLCRCASRRRTGPRAALPRRTCSSIVRALSQLRASISSMSPPARRFPGRSRCTAACGRHRSRTRSATRSASRPWPSATSTSPITSTRSSPPAAPTCAPSRARTWRIRPGPWRPRRARVIGAQWWPKQYLSGKSQLERNLQRAAQLQRAARSDTG